MNFERFWHSTEIEVPDRAGAAAKVQVWGASNEDEAAAAAAADVRAAQARAFFRDRAADYEYGNGYIREEVVDELLDEAGERLAVITRNRYGALVLNTERVLFGDIDLPREHALLRLLNRLGRRPRDKQYYLDRIRRFQVEHADFSFSVYETCAGLRFVVTNQEIRPDHVAVELLFQTLPVDQLYRRLCRTQLCFRARLTAKPWRIGLAQPQVRFPFADQRERRSFDFWLAQYLAKARNTCAARRLEHIGTGTTSAAIQRLLDVHDRYACDDDAILA